MIFPFTESAVVVVVCTVIPEGLSREPALTRFLLTTEAVEVGPTVMPHEDPNVAAPKVAPLRVTVMVVPAANDVPAATVSTTKVAAGVAALKVKGVAVTT